MRTDCKDRNPSEEIVLRGKSHAVTIAILLSLILPSFGSAQSLLNPEGAPRYGNHALAPGFSPAPARFNGLSGGDIAVKSLNLGDNCLGYAASDPDFLIELSEEFSRITFLNASAEDTTLIINLPNGSWACNDDTNGLNPALVFHNAPPGPYQVWIGSYAAETTDQSVLYISEAGPEALPTTATGPDPGRDPLYGETSLSPLFQPTPFTIQFIGGGRNPVADYVDGEGCRGYVSEAPDFSVYLSDAFTEIWFAVHSPADMTLLVNAADGSWLCSDDYLGVNPAVGLHFPLSGLYDVWLGSAAEGNYAAGIFYVAEKDPAPSLDFRIDASCEGMLDTALRVGAVALVTAAAGSGIVGYIAPETGSTSVFLAPAGSALSLVGGPVCAEEHRWWRADLGGGRFGWVADGDASTRWLEPQP